MRDFFLRKKTGVYCVFGAVLLSSFVGPTGKEVPLDVFLGNVAAGVIAGLLVWLVTRRFK
jgi:hypothetical protein